MIEGVFMKDNMKKVRSTIALALALSAGLAFSGTASAFTFEHGWSCQNKWYQMGLIELIACGGGGDG
ncbi:Secreted protein [Pseudomonas marginalis]